MVDEVPETMNRNARSKADVLALMPRVGLGDRVEEAALRLPDPIDLVRDSEILAELGISFDQLVDQLGGSAW